MFRGLDDFVPAVGNKGIDKSQGGRQRGKIGEKIKHPLVAPSRARGLASGRVRPV